MKTNNSNASDNKVKQIVTHAKTIPIAVYQLLFLNFVLFVGLVCRSFSLIYTVGTFVFVVLFLVSVGRLTRTFNAPE